MPSMVHSPAQEVAIVTSAIGVAATSTVTGQVVDTLGYSRALVKFHITSHDHTTGDETLTVKLQSGTEANAGDMADITGAAFTAITSQTIATNTGNIYLAEVNLESSIAQRYYRAVATAAGTTPIDTYTVEFLLFGAANVPVTQQEALSFRV